MSSESILITGGAGFIGCGLGTQLIGKGAEVIAVDSLHPQVHARSGRPLRVAQEVTLYPFDVTDGRAWDALLKLERPSVVVHLAAETGTGQSLRESNRHGETNVVGTTQMLDSFTRTGHVPDHLVLASSRAIYGEGEWIADGERYYPSVRRHHELMAGQWDPISASGVPGESIPSAAARTRAGPSNIYAATKFAQELIFKAWGAGMDCPVSILRFQNVYGVGQSLENPYTGVLSFFTQLAIRGEQIPVYEDGNIVRDFVYVDDVVEAICRTIVSPPAVARVVDVGSGVASTILEVAQQLAMLTGAPDPKVTGQFRDGDVRAASCDIDAATVELGFRPHWSLEDGLNALVP